MTVPDEGLSISSFHACGHVLSHSTAMSVDGFLGWPISFLSRTKVLRNTFLQIMLSPLPRIPMILMISSKQQINSARVRGTALEAEQKATKK